MQNIQKTPVVFIIIGVFLFLFEIKPLMRFDDHSSDQFLSHDASQIGKPAFEKFGKNRISIVTVFKSKILA